VLEALRGTSVRRAEVQELLTDSVQVFRGSVSSTLTAWGPLPSPALVGLLVAVIVGGAVAVWVRRTLPAASGRPTD